MAQNEKVLDVLAEYEGLTSKEQEQLLQRLVERKYEITLKERIDLSKKKHIGRPSRMQPHIIERLLIALRQGASINVACKFSGVSHDLFEIWAKKGREYQDALRKSEARKLECEASGEVFKLTPYEARIIEKPNKETMECVELFVLIDQAIAECAIRDLSLITKAAQNGAWTASAWRLNKRFPEDFGDTQQQGTNVNVQVGFQYVEVNKALPVGTGKDFREAERRSIQASELNIIETGDDQSN